MLASIYSYLLSIIYLLMIHNSRNWPSEVATSNNLNAPVLNGCFLSALLALIIRIMRAIHIMWYYKISGAQYYADFSSIWRSFAALTFIPFYMNRINWINNKHHLFLSPSLPATAHTAATYCYFTFRKKKSKMNILFTRLRFL